MSDKLQLKGGESNSWSLEVVLEMHKKNEVCVSYDRQSDLNALQSGS